MDGVGEPMVRLAIEPAKLSSSFTFAIVAGASRVKGVKLFTFGVSISSGFAEVFSTTLTNVGTLIV